MSARRPLASLPPRFADWFGRRGWAPHPHQLAMLRAAERRRHALLVAPTGGGKTLAGFLPSLIDLAEKPRRGLHTLYVSPLKALAADIARNLGAPIAEIGLAIRCETRTGDTSQARRQRQRISPPQILLTTPESLSLLLSFPEADAMFAGLHTVVIDELHALAPTKRGDLLALALSRLSALAPQHRRAGLSATVPDEDGHRRWLAPGGDAGAVELVRGAPGPEPAISILDAGARIPWSGHMALHALPDIYEAIRTHKTTLVFVNTRAQAELVFQGLWHLNEDHLAIALHHGSLEKAQRLRVEAAMAAGSLRAIVCTSSLDLGIDWGDVDLVVQVGAPKGASRLVQRIGRANHRYNDPSKALLVPGNRFEFLECRAAAEAVHAGELDGDALRPGGLDVLAQHILSTACSGPVDQMALYEQVRNAGPYTALDRKTFDDVFGFVATGGYALGAYERYRRLKRDDDGRWHIADGRFARQYRMNAGVIVDAPTLKVRLGNGRSLGQVEEYFAMGLLPGDTFLFAGRLLRFEGIRELEVIATTAKGGGPPKIPAFEGGRMPFTTHLSARVRSTLAAPRRWHRYPAQVREWLDAQRARSILPGGDGLLVETFPRGEKKQRRQFLVAYCFEGRNAHQTLGMLLTRRMERAGLHPLGFVATDYVIAIWSLEPATEMESLFDQDMLGDDLEAWMAESTMLKRCFRNVAVIAGLIDRRHPGQVKSGRQVTFNADLIYDVLRKHEPGHILLRATRADAATGLVDLGRLAGFLERIKGRITHVPLEKISPLAVPVLLEIGREGVMGEAIEEILRREADLVAEAGLAPQSGGG
ncbi:MAG: ligase-associated DNA damage response DEXH box helicase [Rhodospirillaceae bacterium]|nr:ligase-associated DNA damage response DEXH box helicase [Rhodospirillaceae bacterium]